MSEVAGAAPSAGVSSSFADALSTPGAESGNRNGAPTSVREAIAREQRSDSDDFDVAKQEARQPPEAREAPKRKAPADPVEQPRKAEGDRVEARRQPPTDDLDMSRMVKVKVNGQEREVSLKDALDFYQRGESANKRFQEAADIRKQAEDARQKAERMLRDPKALVEALLDDADGVKSVHEAYTELQRLAQMTPEQQQEYLRVKALEQRDGQLRRMEEAQQAQQAEAREKAILDQHLDGLEDAYEKIGWSPSEKMTDVTDMLAANLIEDMREQGLKGTYRQVAETVREAVMDLITDHVGALDEAGLRELIGEKRLRKLMNGEVQQLQSRLPRQTTREEAPPRQPNGRFKEPAPYIHHAGDMRGFKSLVEGD